MKKFKVYIASPYINGHQADNVRLQVDVKHILLKLGQIPFAPLLGHFFELIYPQNRYNYNMLEWDLEWLKVCDMVVRIHSKYDNGDEIPSSGAERECEEAKSLGIPVIQFNDINELKKFFNKKKNLKDLQKS